MVTDMTQGKPARLLIRFALPMLLSVMFQQLYNIVDSMVAGRFIGEGALAAVGASYPVTMIFMAVATGANIGCSVIISQYFGAHAHEHLKTAVCTSVITMLGVSLAMTLVGVLFCGPFMRLLGTPDDIFADSMTYLNIYVYGLIFLCMYNIFTGVFTALGDSRTPLYFLIFSSLFNIALDLFMVIVLHMGVAGVAIATFIAQGISAVLAGVTLLRRLRAIPSGRYALFSPSMLQRIARVAVPSILQQSFVSVGNLFVQSLVNGYGSAVIAGYSAAVKLNTFSITSMTTVGNAASSFTAQNVGAGNTARVREGLRAGMVVAMLITMLFFVPYFFFSRVSMSLFLAEGGAALQTGVRFLRIVSPFYFVVCIKLVCDGVLRGAGAMKQFMITTFSDLILRVLLAFVLSGLMHDSLGIWLSWPLGWTVGAVLSYYYYHSGAWENASAIL